MAILESIAAANAAYCVIKTALGNGKETAGVISSIGKFLAAEEDIKQAVQKKKTSPLTAITGGEEGDWEEFQALENIRQKRAELESWCRLMAPPGTGGDFPQCLALSATLLLPRLIGMASTNEPNGLQLLVILN